MLKSFFESEKIPLYRELPIEEIAVTNEKKFSAIKEKIGGVESVIVFLIPYFAGQKTTNLSVYAQPRDYHLYIRELSERFSAHLIQNKFSGAAVGLADTAPIDERRAALSASLGFLGKNGLIINETYGSFFFIGEFFLSRAVNPEKGAPPRFCPDCGACVKACPTGAVRDPKRLLCLSYLSQKKDRTEEESALLAKQECKWGCDLCQNVCPFNQRAERTKIPFFLQDHVEKLTEEVIESPKSEFLSRAFSWRGRELLRKNIKK